MSIRSTLRCYRALILAVVALAATGCGLRHARKAEVAGLPPNQAWFAKQRMSSGEPIPLNALRRAMMVEGRGDAGGPALGLSPGTWSAAGPTNIGGRLTALAVDPNDSNHVWAGAAAGGVFESRDAGDTWTPVFDGQP